MVTPPPYPTTSFLSRYSRERSNIYEKFQLIFIVSLSRVVNFPLYYVFTREKPGKTRGELKADRSLARSSELLGGNRCSDRT